MGITSPAETLRARDPCDERCPDGHKWKLTLSRPRVCRRDRGRRRGKVGFHYRRLLSLRSRLDRAWLQLAQEGGVTFDHPVAPRHFFVGGSSPVPIRQTFDAARRATIVAAALNAA
jgi:hypothetical protein